MPDLPSGTVTFLFTDIEGSTALWERDRAAMAAAVQRHLALLDAAIKAHGGVHFKTVGDAAQAAFPTAPDAVAAALDAQRALGAEEWGEIGELRVRMSLHAGEAIPDARRDYLAAPLNRLSRLLSTGYGGQILLSQAVQQLTRGALPPGVELRDLGEHRLRDLLEPERVFQLVHPDVPNTFPSLRSLDARPHNLPLQPTSFLGREREVDEVVERLRRPDVRLLTLTGPGGTGKTRLALQAAAEVLDGFVDGVYFVPLAALADPDLVPSAIATAVGIREEGERSLIDRLTGFLADKQILLVVDNAEHLLQAAPLVGEFLGAAPGLKVLATSRVPLRLRAEWEYPVPPLGLPQRNPPPPVGQLSQYEAVRLFIERAQAVKPDFALDNANAPAVVEICQRLDGLPLAIELAAARVRLLPPQALLARLEKRLPLLTGGARDAPARQRTLHDTIAWSYDLLEPADQILFRRLAVVAGGCTLDTAEAVANPDGELDVFGGLDRLVEHSLVRQEPGRAGEPRFPMLETIREFGLERLAASGEESSVRDAHATVFRALGGDCQRDYAGRAAQWLAQLVAEADNVRAAVAWADRTNDHQTGLALALALGYLAMHRGGLAEPQHWLSRFLTGDAPPSPLRAHATAYEGVVTLFLGVSAEALAIAKTAEEIARAAGSDLDVGYARLIQAMALEDLGEWDEAAAGYTDALVLCEHLVPTHGAVAAVVAAEAHNGLGAIAEIHQSDRDAAGRHYEAALHTAEAAGIDRTHRGVYLQNLAGIERERGHATRATALLAEALPLAWEANDFRLVASGLEEVAWCAIAAGQHHQAARLLGAFRAQFMRMGFADEPILVAQRERFLTTVQKAIGPAAFAEAWEDGQNLSVDEALREALVLLDEVGRDVVRADLPDATGGILPVEVLRGTAPPLTARSCGTLER